ncbi:hypothetical protein BUALT_Bualt06G0050900 [Buddleja alternifolia]|uniref:Uncharacterized protein n=2 Tax=Buddleja alternifolia TaxID=168488 RepID=A0AAV6XEC3_9LAMI|nr:hypothetical protein BUALT_Bualt06G0050900 [Buddleja alternifolia]
MEGRVQVMSREIIRPSSQTPHHLKKLKLSYLDQLSPTTYIPLIFFYQADEIRGLTTSNHVQISQHLKHSLSNTLASFYPLAGKIQDNSFVDCNDYGCQFIEARVQTRLMDVIKEPNMEFLKQMVLVDPIGGHETLVAVQITFFDCGGIAIVVSISHQIADFTSQLAFIDAWAATFGGKSEVSRFSFDLASYFPTRDFPSSNMFASLMSTELFPTKMLVFDREKLSKLKQAAISSSGSIVKDPTSVEVASAFIWKHFIESVKSKNMDAKKTFAATQGVNLRPRTSPPNLLKNVFGNCIMIPTAFSNDKSELHDLVHEFRSAIRTINGEYIGKAQSGDTYVNDLSTLLPPLMNGELEWCGFSSWCRFPVYEVDYGWGKPIWFCTTALPFNNSGILVSSRSGDGIEAWLSMPPDNIEVLQTQMELL